MFAPLFGWQRASHVRRLGYAQKGNPAFTTGIDFALVTGCRGCAPCALKALVVGVALGKPYLRLGLELEL